MSFGFSVKNSGQQLVVDQRALSLTYAGRPAYAQGGTVTSESGFTNYKSYDFSVPVSNLNALPVVVARLREGHAINVDTMFMPPTVGGNATAVVTHGVFNGDYLPLTPVMPDLYLYQVATAPTPQYGVRVLPSGNGTGWVSSDNVAWFRQRILTSAYSGGGGSVGATGDSYALTAGALTAPGVVGSAAGTWRRSYWGSVMGSTFEVLDGYGGYCWVRYGGTLYRRPVALSHPDSINPASTITFTLPQVNALITETDHLT